jgi:hypothetical protein
MPGDAPNPLVIAALVLGVVALAAWVFMAHRKRQKAQQELLDRLGFRPCPEEKSTLEALVNRLVNDKDHHYRIEQPRRLQGEPAIYHFVKRRDGSDPDDRGDAGEELLFRVKRRSRAGVVLAVKPSSLAPGIATRMLGALATGPWTTQPDDLQRLELPADLVDTNLLGALGPAGSSLYDLVEARILSAVQGIGDSGGWTIRLRDEWCTVEAGHWQVPFRVDEIVARMRPLA